MTKSYLIQEVINIFLVISCPSNLAIFLDFLTPGLICCFVCLLFLGRLLDSLHLMWGIINSSLVYSTTITVQNKLVPTYDFCSS